MKYNYPKFKIIEKSEKEQFEKLLKKQFGVKEIPGILLQRGAERIFIYQGNLEKKEIKELEKTINIERIGIYFGKLVQDKKTQKNELRLSIDGIHILKDQITKNIFEIPDKETLENWMQGNELNIETGFRGFVIMRYKKDFVGCGKASEKKITNFIPKNRRLKEKEII